MPVKPGENGLVIPGQIHPAIPETPGPQGLMGDLLHSGPFSAIATQLNALQNFMRTTQSSTPRQARVTSIVSSATPTPDADTTDLYIITALAEAAAFGIPTGNLSQGQKLVIRIKDNGVAQGLSFNAIYRAILALPTTTVVGKLMYLGFFYNSTDTKWDLVARVEEA